jgi:serine/threonine-protein kinase RsbW
VGFELEARHDISVGSVPALAVEQRALRVMTSRESRNMEKTQTTLESTLDSVDKAETLVMEEAGKNGFDDDDQQQIGMAIRECMVNAVVHGNRYNKNKKVHLEIDRSSEALTVIIGDEGAGFDINSLPDPLAPENLLRQSGRGLLLIRAFMDEFDLHPRPGGGTEVRLVKHVRKP